MKEYPLYRMANYLYKYAFGMYLPLYRVYKILTDRIERKLCRQIVTPGDCVLDIGANIGIYTRYFSKLVGDNGEIHAFEPDATHFHRLTQYTKSCRNVQLHHAAVSSNSGEITLYLSEDLNVDHRTYLTEDERNTCQVACIRIDDYFSEKRVDFIKMDIQGYEYTSLLGMKNTLLHNTGIQMIMEFCPYQLKQAGSSKEAVIEFLYACDFDIYLISHMTLVKFEDTLIKSGNTDYYNLFVTR